jgi:putative membrane-bound dehydrogenase-like protein
MIYANHDSITADQESALLQFVKEGGGFLPIHCASWCFRNSESYVELVGAQFKSHGEGVFKAEIVNANHPITNGYQVFESWDETYVSDKHHPDNIVLMERVEGDHREPWTWVREYGRGRIFYTAYGHDQQTWGQPGFQDLIFRGILWSIGEERQALWAQLEFPSHQYLVSTDIANYEKREQPLKLQEPFEPHESEKFIQVPAGFELELFASEPDIINPIFMNWDEKGRLWVIETVDYPNQVNEDGAGNDRIKICEDTDGDGLADKFTVFADGLNIPTSLVFSNGGIIVSAAPDFYFLKDTDGDDIADQRETLISGWGTFDTHAGPSNLKYGFDNYIWGTVGYSAFEGSIGNSNYKFGQGIYRFHPKISDFEFVTATSNNTWGLGFSETFDVFASTANNAHSWYLGIPDRYLAGLNGINSVGSKKIANYYAFHPITPNVRQVDVFGGFTAAAGHNIYTARAYPKEYWNRMAFICEPTGHLLAQGELIKDGAGYILQDQWNLMASSDEWVSPVHAEVGPDGAVWVADWYNFIIQHNPTPTVERGGYQAETGEGNAHINPLRDRSYGRIYRLVHKDSKAYKPLKLSANDPDQLIEALSHPNLFWRLTAQRLLVESGNMEVAPALMGLVENTSVDEIGLNAAAIHALWTLHGLGAIDGNDSRINELVEAALNHPAAGVRKAAIQVMPANNWALTAMVDQSILSDPDPHTQLAAFLRVSEMPPSAEVGQILYDLSKEAYVVEDLWLSQALLVAARQHFAGFSQAYSADEEAIAYQKEEPRERAEPPSIWNKWENPNQVTAQWTSLEPGKAWEEHALGEFDGRVLAYKTFQLNSLPEESDESFLNLGRIGQSDRAFINGTMLHETRNDPEVMRKYQIPISSLKLGLNYIVVSITDDKGPGGFLGPKDQMSVEIDETKIPLDGSWKYFIQERKSRGINYSNFDSNHQLAAFFLAYNTADPNQDASNDNTSSSQAAHQIRLTAVRNEMRYDLDEMVVTAGRLVQIEFENTDLMQHNLLITLPGSLERVGAAADALAQRPEGQEAQYVPNISEVLFSTVLVNPGETVILEFTAPSEPGDYPFVCTFPGHWQTMNGILRVEAVAN